MLSDTTLKMIRIVKDKKGKYLFSTPKKNTTYVVPENKLYLFFLFTYRYTLIIMTAFMMYTINLQYWVIGVSVVLLLILLEWYYRQQLLGKFQKLENYVLSSSHLKGNSRSPLVYVRIILYIILIGTFIYLGLTKYAGKTEQYLFYIGALLSLVFGYQQLRNGK